MLISSFDHLMDDIDEEERKYLKMKLSDVFSRIESRYKKPIVLIEKVIQSDR